MVAAQGGVYVQFWLKAEDPPVQMVLGEERPDSAIPAKTLRFAATLFGSSPTPKALNAGGSELGGRHGDLGERDHVSAAITFTLALKRLRQPTPPPPTCFVCAGPFFPAQADPFGG
jgi:hypothetical protein